MSRAKQRGKALGEIAMLRRISTRQAEQQALQAQRSLRDAQQDCQRQADRLTDVIAEWHSALAAPRFDPIALTAWSSAVNDQVEIVAESKTVVLERNAEMDAAEAAHGRASAEERCADTLLRRVRVQIARRRDEGRLAEQDDVNMRRMALR